MGQPPRSQLPSANFNLAPFPAQARWQPIFCDIKPLRLLLLLVGVTVLATTVPVEAQPVKLMTPLYQTLPGVFGN